MGTEKYFLQKTLYLYEKYQIYLRRRFQASLKSKTFILKVRRKQKAPYTIRRFWCSTGSGTICNRDKNKKLRKRRYAPEKEAYRRFAAVSFPTAVTNFLTSIIAKNRQTVMHICMHFFALKILLQSSKTNLLQIRPAEFFAQFQKNYSRQNRRKNRGAGKIQPYSSESPGPQQKN